MRRAEKKEWMEKSNPMKNIRVVKERKKELMKWMSVHGANSRRKRVILFVWNEANCQRRNTMSSFMYGGIIAHEKKETIVKKKR